MTVPTTPPSPSVVDRYRAALLAQPAISTITLADGTAVAVEDVYVPRTLLHEVKQKKSEQDPGRGNQAGERDATPEREITVKLPVDLWSKLDQERVVVVEGPAGIGKSTLTKQLVRASRAHYPIPIWIAFRPFVASGLSIGDYLDHYYVPWLGLAGVRVPYRVDGTGPDRSLGQWLFEQWRDGFGGLLIIDGLDEVFQYDERVTALQGLPITRTGATRPATILTSRPLSQSLPIPMAKVEVQGLTPSEQLQFVARYRASLHLTEDQVTHFINATRKQEQGRLRELLTRPGHLIQILTTYARTNTLLDTETAVLDELLKSRLTITGRSEPPVEPEEPEKKHRVLASLALHLLACRQGQRHTRAQLLALIQQVLREHATNRTPLFPLVQATALLSDLTRNSALLTEMEPEVYEFETVIWLQHLAGQALAHQDTMTALGLAYIPVLKFLDKKAWDPEWEPVLMSWVRNSHNPVPFLRSLTDARCDDFARHRLGTAGRCLRELSSRAQGAMCELRDQIALKSFARWNEETEWGTDHLLLTSLRETWMETEIGQIQLGWMLERSSRDTLVRLIEAIGTPRHTMPEVIQRMLLLMLLDEDSTVREAVAKSLNGCDGSMPGLLGDTLANWLADGSNRNCLQRQVMYAIGGLGGAMPQVVQQELMARSKDYHNYTRSDRASAVHALGKLGGAMSEVVQQALVARLWDEEGRVGEAAVYALSRLGDAMSAQVQEALVVMMDGDWDGDGRGYVVQALNNLGSGMTARVQEALLVRMNNGGDEGLRDAAVEAASKLGKGMTTQMQEALVTELTNGDVYVRIWAARALGRLGEAMPESIEEILVPWLTDEDKRLRRAAVNALGNLGEKMTFGVREALVARLADQDQTVRAYAVEAVSNLGKRLTAQEQEALISRLADEDWYVRAVCVAALAEAGCTLSARGNKELLARLADSSSFVREAACRAHGKLWVSLTAEGQQVLVGRLRDKECDVRGSAAEALFSVQQQGWRFFGVGGNGRGQWVSELSSTIPFSDSCHTISHGRFKFLTAY